MDYGPITIALYASLIAYAFTFLYSIYMAVLNHKQAKVKDSIDQTNETLNNIYIKLDEIREQNKRK